MNSRALSDKARYLASKYNVTANLIINHYFFDAILKRISVSRYSNRLILKGGYLLSISFGIITRTTNDLDFLFNDQFNDDETIVKMIKDIIRTMHTFKILS